MKTLSEFFYEKNKEEFDDVEDAKNFLNEMKEEEVHYGDCTKQNVPCLLCEFTQLLEDYYMHIKEKK